MSNQYKVTGLVNNRHDQFQQELPNVTFRPRIPQKKPYIKILEQPADHRFRYECETRHQTAGSIPGVNSTQTKRTYPTIEIIDYKGPAIVIVSCVTINPPYQPHPNNLIGKNCIKGVSKLVINSKTMKGVFSKCAIECVKKADIDASLKIRQEIQVDPFMTRFQCGTDKIDLNSLRLCFQVFLINNQTGKFSVPLKPVVSDPIHNKKVRNDLVLTALCSYTSPVSGGKDIILLCGRISRYDISIRFFQVENGKLLWEGYGTFSCTNVHKQTAIKFKTPNYKTLNIEQPVKAFVQLRRPSDGKTSKSLPFDFLPSETNGTVLKSKRAKLNDKKIQIIDIKYNFKMPFEILKPSETSCEDDPDIPLHVLNFSKDRLM